MNLFLASTIESTIDTCIEEYKLVPRNTPVLYIATAGNCYTPLKPLNDRGSFQCLVERKFPVKPINLEQIQHEELKNYLEASKIVVVGGGNTYYLLYHVLESGFAEMLPSFLDKGLVYIGSSAGSCVCSPHIGYIKTQDDPSQAPELTDYRGLNLINVEIYPHCIESYYEEAYTPEYLFSSLRSPAKKIFLRDHQALLVKDDMYKIV